MPTWEYAARRDPTADTQARGIRTEKVADDERLDDAARRHFGPGARVALSDYSYPTDCPLVGFLEVADGTFKVVDINAMRCSKAEDACAEAPRSRRLERGHGGAEPRLPRGPR